MSTIPLPSARTYKFICYISKNNLGYRLQHYKCSKMAFIGKGIDTYPVYEIVNVNMNFFYCPVKCFVTSTESRIITQDTVLENYNMSAYYISSNGFNDEQRSFRFFHPDSAFVDFNQMSYYYVEFKTAFFTSGVKLCGFLVHVINYNI